MKLDYWLLADFAVGIASMLLAMRAFAALDPVLDEEGNVFRYRGWWKGFAWVFAGAFGRIFITYLTVAFQPLPNSVIAPLFAASAGCASPYFSTDNRSIPTACIHDRYEIDPESAYRLGLRPADLFRDPHRWFRVGNDAAFVECVHQFCDVLSIQRGVYRQQGS